MSVREIVTYPGVGLVQNEQGQYVVSKPGYKSYILKEDSRTGLIIRILDSRCLAQQRRYNMVNSTLNFLEEKLTKIESSRIYRFFHRLGLM